MKLINRIIIHTAIALAAIISLWMCCTYFMTISEIYDEIDDTLEGYAHKVIERADMGFAPDTLTASMDIGTGIHIEQVTPEYGQSHRRWKYYNEEIYIDEVREEQDSRAIRFTHLFGNGIWYEVTIFTPSFDQKDFSGILINSSAVLGISLILATIIIIGFILYGSMKPMYNIVEALMRHKPGEISDIPLSRDDITEFRLIREALISSMRRDKEVYEQQKMFIGNASHEIQTPLAVCHNSIEMLVEDPDTTPSQMELLARIDDRLGYISRLNRTLLLLTKIDNSQYDDTECVSLSSLAIQYAEDLSEIHSDDNISTETEGKGQYCAEMNLTLAKSLVGNLVKNAFTHNIRNGKVLIRWNGNGMEVANTSASRALDSSRIFERFYKGPEQRNDSTGLGLSIAKSICTRYGYSVTYSYLDSMHVFRISKNSCTEERIQNDFRKQY